MEEGGIHAGVAEHEGGLVDDLRFLHQRCHHVFGGVDEGEQLDAGVPTGSLEGCGQHLGLRVAGTRAEPAQRAVDEGGALLGGGQRVGDSDAQIVVGVEADVGRDRRAQGGDPLTGLLRHHRAGGVDE